MDLRTLRSFVVLARHAHFTRAASELGIVQPALSKHIRLLEEELGVRLFERTRRDVRLSAAGERLLDPARRALEAAEDVRRTARDVREGAAGQLRIGFTPTAPATIVARAVEAFQRAHPRTACRVSQASSEELLDAIERAAIDVALVRLDAARRRDGVASLAVLEEPFVVALPARHRLARRRAVRWRDLEAEPFVMVRRQAAPVVYDEIVAACRGAGFSPSAIDTARDVHGALAVVSAGGGVAIVPASTPRLPTVVFRPLLDPRLTTTLGAAWRASAEPSGAAAFVRLMKAAPRR